MNKTSITPPRPTWESVLDLLSSVIIQHGDSLSWYTSKKGRIWITLKGFRPTTYTTSVEYDAKLNAATIMEAYIVVLYHHMKKLALIEPPLNTWLVTRAVADQCSEALAWLVNEADRYDPMTGELKPPPFDSTLGSPKDYIGTSSDAESDQ